jgi:hypothetical protein
MQDAFGVYGLDQITNFKNPKRIRLTAACVYLESYFKEGDRGMIAKARKVLDEHNIELDVFQGFGTKTSWNTIPNTSEPIADNRDAYLAVYRAAKAKISQMGCGFVIPLPIVFCQFNHSGYAIAPRAEGVLNRFCMISPNGNADLMDVLHEIGHAAGLSHDEVVPDPRNFMHQASPRSTVYKFQVEAFAKAPFAVG